MANILSYPSDYVYTSPPKILTKPYQNQLLESSSSSLVNLVNKHLHKQLEVISISSIPIASQHHYFPLILVLVPITVNMVYPILRDCIFRSLIPFLSSILPYLYLVHNIYTHVVSTWHLQHVIYLCPSTRSSILYNSYYFNNFQNSSIPCSKIVNPL